MMRVVRFDDGADGLHVCPMATWEGNDVFYLGGPKLAFSHPVQNQ